MKIKLYNSFLEYLLESVKKTIPYYYSNRFREVLVNLANNGDVISPILLDAENSNQVSDDITLIDLTDKEDMVSFIQLNRMERFREGEEKEIDILDYVKSVWTNHVRNSETDLEHRGWKEQRTEIGIGRFVTRVFQKGKLTPTASNIEKFVNSYKTRIKMINDPDSLFEFVKGDDIKKWYFEGNYQSNKGQLSNSCMRYRSCQGYFDIYTKNPEVCQLLILKGSERDKISGRALIWKLNDGKTYMDRQYCNDDSDISLYREFAKKNGWIYYGDLNLGQTLEVELNKIKIEQFPYMDTFLCYNCDSHLLSSDEDLWPESGWWKLQSTSGGYLGDDVVYSEYNEEYISTEDAVYCVDVRDWRRSDQAVYLESRDRHYSNNSDEICYSEYLGENLHIDDAVYSELLETWIYSDDSVSCWVSSDEAISIPDDMKDTVTRKLTINGKEKVCLLEAIMIDPFTNEWVFRKDRVTVYYCPKTDTEITKEYAESHDLEIDESKKRRITVGQYISSQIGDVDPDPLFDYLVGLSPSDEMLEKIKSYFRRDPNGWFKNGDSLEDIDKFNLIKCGIWFSYKDDEKNDYFVVRNKDKNSYGFVIRNKSVFLNFVDDDVYSKFTKGQVICGYNWGALIEAGNLLIWDIIKDPEMRKIYYAINF